MTNRNFIAVDWGTTNRRAYLMVDGAVVESIRDDLGILAVPPDGYPAAAAAIRERWGNLPMLLAGMVGSDRGWAKGGYVPCPARLEGLAAGVSWITPDVALIPGVSLVSGGRADVMRGEEVQLLGATVAGIAPPDALLCQPGTHCKWAVMEGGTLVSFTSVMTGEMFALLRNHALIGSTMAGDVDSGAAFLEGVRRSADADLLAHLFGVRPASILGLRDDRDAAAYVSGLLIGNDCRARVGAGDTVHILADPHLGTLYGSAIREIGATSALVDSHAAFCAGITRIWSLLDD